MYIYTFQTFVALNLYIYIIIIFYIYVAYECIYIYSICYNLIFSYNMEKIR